MYIKFVKEKTNKKKKAVINATKRSLIAGHLVKGIGGKSPFSQPDLILLSFN